MAASNASNGLAGIVGGNLRALRKARGWTQADLAEAIGLRDFMAVSRWERGEHRPSEANIVALAEALNVTVADLYMEQAA